MPVIENNPSAGVQGKPFPLIARETVPPLIGGDDGPLPLLSMDVELVLGPDDEEPVPDPFNPEPVSPVGSTFNDLCLGQPVNEAFL